MRERDRIATELQNEVIQRIFAIGLSLQGTVSITIDPLVRRRVEQAITDLDQVVQVIRDTIFHLETHLRGQGLRAAIVHLSEQLSPVPDVTFHGPVDGALHPTAAAELRDILDDAVTVLRKHWALAAIDITAADGAHLTRIQVVSLPDARAAGETDDEFPRLRDRAARAGMHIEIKPGPESVQITWYAA